MSAERQPVIDRIPVATRASAVTPSAPAQLPAIAGDATSLMAVISRAASDPATDVDKLDRLLAMYERITANEAKSAYASAYVKLQPELPIIDQKGRLIIKDKTEKVIQSTPFAKWEDINEAIVPILARHGFGLSFDPGLAADGKITMTALLLHDRGHVGRATVTLPYDASGSKNGVQAVGSSMTYGKRYSALAILNVTSRAPQDADDDGKGADEDTGVISPEQLTEIRRLIDETGIGAEKVCSYAKVDALPSILAEAYPKVVDAIKRWGSAQGKAARK